MDGKQETKANYRQPTQLNTMTTIRRTSPSAMNTPSKIVTRKFMDICRRIKFCTMDMHMKLNPTVGIDVDRSIV